MEKLTLDQSDVLACTNVLLKFFRDLDELNYDECLKAFVPDAKWERKGELLSGHADIRATLEARPADLIICHLISNIEIDAVAESQVRLRYVLIGYDAKVKTDGTRPAGRLGGIRRGDDRMVKTDEGWKFTLKLSHPVMLGAA